MANTNIRSIAELEKAVRTCPVIDNHAHNLLRNKQLRAGNDLIGITSEASGRALEDVPTSIAHTRALSMLLKFVDLPEDSTWEDFVTKREALLSQDLETYLKKCLEGTYTILVDDGYEDSDMIETYDWHDRITQSPCRRIERIETAAEDILESMYTSGKLPTKRGAAEMDLVSAAWTAFTMTFDQAIITSILSDQVVGFKSAICYTTGLNVDMSQTEEERSAEAMGSFQREYLLNMEDQDFAINCKKMNDFLVLRVCQLLTAHRCLKPFQFHTGLGSNNMSLLYSNPTYLQSLLEAYEKIPFVLLHSSYPFTREAGYLASVYKNCFLDIGLVWPEVSRNGQENVIRQAFELTPWSKLLWSTDGHYFSETFYLANVQGRVAMERVLKEYINKGDLKLTQAVRAVQDIFFENSNRLYRLGLTLEMPDVDSEQSAAGTWFRLQNEGF